MRSKIISLFTLLLLVIVVALFSGSALAADCDTCSGQTDLSSAAAIQCGTNCAGNKSTAPAQAAKNLSGTITSIIQVVSIIVAAVAVIMLMLGGFRYVTSGGSQEAVAGAKRSITYAIVGLVVAALAQLIVHFVLAKTKATIK